MSKRDLKVLMGVMDVTPLLILKNHIGIHLIKIEYGEN
jgi:hypothetical protein